MYTGLVSASLIRWGPDLELGIEELDAQHRSLVDLANRLFSELAKSKGGSVARRAVAELFAYSATHFAEEEEYFARFNFASVDKHKQSHAAFMARASEFEERLSAGNPADADEILAFLREWIIKHIGREDRELARVARIAKPSRP
jgi:hemerythrin